MLLIRLGTKKERKKYLGVLVEFIKTGAMEVREGFGKFEEISLGILIKKKKNLGVKAQSCGERSGGNKSIGS